MRLRIAPCFRSRRAVSNGGLLLSVAYDLTCFMRFFERYKLCLKNAWLAGWLARGTGLLRLGEPPSQNWGNLAGRGTLPCL